MLNIQPIKDEFGAEIGGVDLSQPVSAETYQKSMMRSAVTACSSFAIKT